MKKQFFTQNNSPLTKEKQSFPYDCLLPTNNSFLLLRFGILQDYKTFR